MGDTIIFVSYSRKDDLWVKEGEFGLIPWLANSLARKNVEIWYDTALKELPGEDFKRKIKSEIDRAQFAILLVSQEFLNSDFIRRCEMPWIKERVDHNEMIVIPILVDHTVWELEDELRWITDRQMLPGTPTPLIEYTQSMPRWRQVRSEILQAILHRIQPSPKSPVVEAAPSRASLSEEKGQSAETGQGAAQGGATQIEPVAPQHTILHDYHLQNLDEVARRVVQEGAEAALQGVPIGHFGQLLTVDPREIEGYRSIHTLLSEYCSRPQTRPISVAVFGPRGASKSFGVRQVARSIHLQEQDAFGVLTFNLSQFHDADELVGAFQQVRDLGLSGKMPLVFWEEFDARLGEQELGWLRYLLAPMQDGSFQDGQIARPIGQAIFVFTSGTCATMEGFCRAAARKERAKAPDFVSHLKGYVNVMGPDPLDVKYPEGDPHFLIRRAILLRSLLQRNASHLFGEPKGSRKLNIDPGVLHAFLHVSSYKHGVRSMESIIAMSTLAGKSRFEPSCLPSQAQLNLHVNGLEFLALVQQPQLSGEMLERLASAMYGYWASAFEATTKSYDELPSHRKQVKRDVLDISHRLASVGCVMVPARGTVPIFTFPEADLEKLAELEHDRWLRAKVAAGWRYGPEHNYLTRANPAILPWRGLSAEEWAQVDPALAAVMGREPLPEEEKEKDRALVRAIPQILAKAGYAVVQLQPEDGVGR